MGLHIKILKKDNTDPLHVLTNGRNLEHDNFSAVFNNTLRHITKMNAFPVETENI